MNNRVPTKFEVEQSKLKGIFRFCGTGVQWGNPGAGWGYTLFESPIRLRRSGYQFEPPLGIPGSRSSVNWSCQLVLRDTHRFTLPLDKVMQAKRAEAIAQYCAACPIVYLSADGEVLEHYVDPVKLSVKELYER